MVFGHAGMGYNSGLPTNSMASLEECLKTGADGVEMDVQMTADSVFFLFHDQDLGDATVCDGKISELNNTSIEGCKYRKDGKRHEVIRASAFFENSVSLDGKLFTFDCKVVQSTQYAFARALMALIRKNKLGDRCKIESVFPSFLDFIEKTDSSLETYFYCQAPEEALREREKHVFDGLTISMELINADQVKTIHAQGLKVSVFGAATQKQNIDALWLSPDNIQTDKVKHLVEVYVKKR